MIPGFSAEVSLYNTSGRYYATIAGYPTATGIYLAYVDQGCFNSCYNNCNQACFGLSGRARGECLRECKQVEQECRIQCTRPDPPPPPPPPECWWGHWCGPGCGGGAPQDDVDTCCKVHDECYDARGYFACSCDRALMDCVWPKIDFLTPKGRAAFFVWTYFSRGWCNPFA